MRLPLSLAALTLAASGAGAPPARPAAGGAGSATLAVWHDGAWRTWWRADRAPRRWPTADPAVAGALRWRASAPGVEWAELRLAGEGEAKRIRVVVARIDPARVRLRLAVTALPDGRRGYWSVDDAPPDALVALDAGQFTDDGPWGWLVLDGREIRPPGHGPLADAVVVDTAGAVRFVEAADVPRVRAAGEGGIATAFQSYPAILRGDGDIPAPLFDRAGGLDLDHRDARLALGELRDGRLLVALTRFDGVGETLGFLPFGPTMPEMAAVMGALGARRAVLLDGGISGQLLLRGASGEVQAWRGMRRVPVGIVAVGRAPLVH